MMTRTWTQEEIISWKNERDKKRSKEGLHPFDSLDATEKKSALEKQRAELAKTALVTMKSTAWSLGRYPLAAYTAPRSGILELPRNFFAAFGCDQLKFKEGDNLNLLTCRYYDEVINPAAYSGSNFVTEVIIQPKRHEYLGPSPKVAGYRFTQDVAEVVFWDDYLDTMWMGKHPWEVELEFDPAVNSWFVAEIFY